jgi:hypothetical protein
MVTDRHCGSIVARGSNPSVVRYILAASKNTQTLCHPEDGGDVPLKPWFLLVSYGVISPKKHSSLP